MLRVPNTSKISNLPSDLFRRGSDIDRLIDVAIDASDKNSYRASITCQVTKDLLHKACPDYKPSYIDTRSENSLVKADVLCRSGEDNGVPYRVECSKCRVGQFSSSGFFVGEVIPVDLLVAGLRQLIGQQLPITA